MSNGTKEVKALNKAVDEQQYPDVISEEVFRAESDLYEAIGEDAYSRHFDRVLFWQRLKREQRRERLGR